MYSGGDVVLWTEARLEVRLGWAIDEMYNKTAFGCREGSGPGRGVSERSQLVSKHGMDARWQTPKTFPLSPRTFVTRTPPEATNLAS